MEQSNHYELILNLNLIHSLTLYQIKVVEPSRIN